MKLGSMGVVRMKGHALDGVAASLVRRTTSGISVRLQEERGFWKAGWQITVGHDEWKRNPKSKKGG